MLFRATPARRKLIVFVLLGLALVGAGIRQFAPNPSSLRDLGTLLLVLWVPVIGNVIAFLVRAVRLDSSALGRAKPFAPHLLLEMSPLTPPAAAPPLAGDRCALVVGTEGFSVRLSQPLAGWLESGLPMQVRAQFLKPQMALALFPQDTAFRVIAQERLVGQGRVLQVLS